MRLLMHDHEDGGGSPFERALDEVLADGEADLACPFIHLSVLEPRLDLLNRWRLLTDVEAWLSITPRRAARAKLRAWWLANRRRVRNLPGLHAKVAIGRRTAMLGSANFTAKGLFGRVEAGVWSDDPLAVAQLREWFDACWTAAGTPDDPAKEWAISVLPTPPPDGSPNSAPRPASLGSNPIRGTRKRSSILAGAVGQPAAHAERVAAALRKRVKRPWAETFLDWLADLIRTAGLTVGSRQLTTTLVERDRCIGVNVNNRSALSWCAGRWSDEPRVYYLLPGPYAEQLQAHHPADVVRRHRLRDGDEHLPLDLLVAAFPPPASFGDPEAFRSQWRSAISREVQRKRGHSPRGQGKHVQLIYDVAVDGHRRRAWFDAVFGPNTVPAIGQS